MHPVTEAPKNRHNLAVLMLPQGQPSLCVSEKLYKVKVFEVKGLKVQMTSYSGNKQ